MLGPALALVAAAAAQAQTTSAVRENVLSSNRLRHQLQIQSQGPEGGLIVFSCRIEDADTIAVAVMLNRPVTGSTTQKLEARRSDGASRIFEMMPYEEFFVTSADEAKTFFQWIFEGQSVAFKQQKAGSAAFDFSKIKADIARFRPLCDLRK
jgi:hypothetical protein